jgi:uncharacterized membrane protein
LVDEHQASAIEHRPIQGVLRGGLALSVLAMAAGLVVRAASGRTDAPALSLFHLFDGDLGLSLCGLGVLVLALTPALRVLVLLALWVREKDFRFVLVALVVLATLGAAVALGKG